MSNHIAIIGMACRLPEANSPEQFWRNLREGRDVGRTMSDDELRAAGVDEATLSDPQYVRHGTQLGRIDQFDAEFFGFSAREADILDPQQRLFLEGCHEALERAGVDPFRFRGRIGTFGGVGESLYFLRNVLPDAKATRALGMFQAILSNSKDTLATRVGYKLDLSGPCVTVQTACSTSLVAVILASQSLLDFQCDIALAGGVTLRVPEAGYLHQPGGITSPDGRCRPFSADASGTFLGSGLGIVVLRRLEDARAERHHIHAVIRGTAMNNDGARKVGFTAPSVERQAEVIAEALAVAELGARDIGYVEAHGTGTKLGDPVEVAALTRAFRLTTEEKGFCYLGSAKSNVGHTDAAAGVVGLIKAALAVEHGEIPPSVHFTAPNPEIDFENSPFRVNNTIRSWAEIRRAGVSSFGIGGTNAHVVVEQPPSDAALAPSGRTHELLIVSARHPESLAAMKGELATFLDANPASLADLAHTLQVGRTQLPVRAAVVAVDSADAARRLRATPMATRAYEGTRSLAFVFSGQGAQYPGMGGGLLLAEPLFRRQLEHCQAVLRPLLGFELLELLAGDRRGDTAATARLQRTDVAQPALFSLEYALATLLLSWGLRPEALLGHSIGEYVAAALAGVLDVDDALRLVAERGRAMQACLPGAMLAVSLSEADARAAAGTDVDIAGVNAHSLTVLSGPFPAIERIERDLEKRGIFARRLQTSHAFHSRMMDPALDAFASSIASVRLQPPRIPILSNRTGRAMSPEEATDPSRWVAHIREPVLFGAAADVLLDEPARAAIEVGPGSSLTRLLRMSSKVAPTHIVVPSLPGSGEVTSDCEVLMGAVGSLWAAGCTVDWAGIDGEKRRRIPAPTYSYRRKRYWLDATGTSGAIPWERSPTSAPVRTPVSEWLWVPSWREKAPSGGGNSRWMVIASPEDAVAEGIRTELGPSRCMNATGPGLDALSSGDESAWERMVRDATADSTMPDGFLFVSAPSLVSEPDATLAGPFALVRAAMRVAPGARFRVRLVSRNGHSVAGETTDPLQAAVSGAARVVSQEYPGIDARSIDLPSNPGRADFAALTGELESETGTRLVAIRGGRLFAEDVSPFRMPAGVSTPLLRSGGRYLIVGGTGQLGRATARALSRAAGATLVLLQRRSLPERERWEEIAVEGSTSPEADVLRDILALERSGARVLVERGDILDSSLPEQINRLAIRAGGSFDGIAFAALDSRDQAHPIGETTRAQVAQSVRSRIVGTRNLAAIVEIQRPTFVILHSSLSSGLGGLGFFAYAAGNAILDSIADGASSPQTHWIAMDWDRWHSKDASDGIQQEEGESVMLAALRAGPAVRRVLVSTTSLPDRRARWLSPTIGRADETPGPSASAKHERPQLTTPHVAPETDIERALANIWEEFLGVGPIGTHDSFFDLGGHSLLAIQITNRVREEFKKDISIRKLFEDPTIAAVARLLEAGTASTPGIAAARVDEEVARIARMSPDELARELARETAVDPAKNR